MRITIKRLDESIGLPAYSHAGDAAFDLPAAQEVVVQPGSTAKIGTGIALAIPPGHVGLVWDRSGLAAKESLHCLAGVVDSSYRGEVCVVLHNLGDKPFVVKKGMRIAQMLIQPVERAELVEGDLEETTRSSKGFGSSGS
ncbi:MAG: dUTP diphosphatase [Nanoarchaeota archaeon]